MARGVPDVSRLFQGGGTTKPASWGKRFPGRGGDTGSGAFWIRADNLNSFMRLMEEDFKDAVEEAADELDRSLRRRVLEPSLRLCPIDTGALRASAWVDARVVAGGRIVGAVGYDTDYAVFVHEVPASHASPTQWKFLEQPFSENVGLVAEDVLAAVRRALD
jgi:hypothetical protein